MSEGLVQDLDSSRRFFYTVWQKHANSQPLEPLEQLVLDIILEHPEYHSMLENEDNLMKDFNSGSGQVNPYLHMGMHITIREQVSINRPAGIRAIYNAMVKKMGSMHAAEHAMLECLGETLWLAQRNNTMPDENKYLESLKRLMD